MTRGDNADSGQFRVWFDAALAGKRVLADGGAELPTGGAAFRDSYEGVLTGRRFEEGDPPWRWLEIGQLANRPEGSEDEVVWCEEGFVYHVAADGELTAP